MAGWAFGSCIWLIPGCVLLDDRLNFHLNIVNDLKFAGGSCWLVGGSVRDELLGLSSKDLDTEVYGLTQDKILSVLEKYGDVQCEGEDFGVYILTTPAGSFDFSLPRTEVKKSPGHQGFSVKLNPSLSHEQACRRRDFTINAIFKDPISGEFKDPLNGRSDLDNKILRAAGPGFNEDPLRVLRGFQFAGRFGLTADEGTLKQCRLMYAESQTLSTERCWSEWKKWGERSQKPSAGLLFLKQAGWLECWPALADLVGVPQDENWHPEGDVWVHTLHVTDEVAEIAKREGLEPEERLMLVLAGICHDLGKPVTTQMHEGRWRSRGHDREGVVIAQEWLTQIGCPVKYQERIVPLVKEHLFYGNSNPSEAAVRRLARRLAPASVRMLCYLMEADVLGRPPRQRVLPASIGQVKALGEQLEVINEAPFPILKGRHLVEKGWKPGPDFKRILDLAFEAQLDGAFDSETAAVQWLNTADIGLPEDGKKPRSGKKENK